jgi:hypothetical protein
VQSSNLRIVYCICLDCAACCKVRSGLISIKVCEQRKILPHFDPVNDATVGKSDAIENSCEQLPQEPLRAAGYASKQSAALATFEHAQLLVLKIENYD